MTQKTLTHVDEAGQANMVNVAQKPVTQRSARALAFVRMQPSTLQLILDDNVAKGEVLGVARVAGILAAKKTSDLIPLCHGLALDAVSVHFYPDSKRGGIEVEAIASVGAKTGVEMEALTAVSVSALTIYDMAKAVDKSMSIEGIHLVSKSGGKSGDFLNTSPPTPFR